METLLAALFLLAGTALLMACCALLPQALPQARRAAHVLGPAGIVLGCGTGLYAVLAGPWQETLAHLLPWGLPLGSGALALDALSRVFLLPVFAVGGVCALSGFFSLRHYPAGEHNLGAHWMFFSLLLLALTLVCTARDAVLFLLAWEVMSLSPFFLIEFHDSESQVREASWIYLVAAHLGVLFLLTLFALLWHESGSTAFALFEVQPTSLAGTLVFALAVLGFGTKAGVFPMHVWLPEAYPAAPSHAAALLSGAVSNAGLYGIFRVLDFFALSTDTTAAGTDLLALFRLPGWWGWALLGLGLATGLVGIFKAMAQNNLKRLLAYSSVENMGIMLMGLGTGLVGLHLGQLWIAILGFTASLMHMLNHAAFKSLLFLCAGEILNSVHTVRLDLLGGLQKRLPLVGAAFALGAASIACLPPFNGFNSEFLLALGLAGGLQIYNTEATLGLLAALTGLALISGMGTTVYIKAYGIAFLGEARSGAAQKAEAAPALEMLPLLPPALACVALGLGAGWLLPQLIYALPHPLSLPLQTPGGSPLASVVPLTEKASLLLMRAGMLGLGMVIITLFILGIRKVLLHEGNAPTRHPTWGCGFQKGSSRIQYSGASFSEPTARFFGLFMGVRVRRSMDKGFFPVKATLEVSAVDRVRSGLFTPLFEGIERVCDALKIIQHGRIHLYILYMLVTVVVLLVWGLQA